MRPKILIALLISSQLLLTSCGIFGSNEEGLDFATYEGIYVYGQELNSFTPCTEEGEWWVDPGNTDLVERYQSLTENTQAIIFVRLQGDPGPAGEYGPDGSYNREFRVEEVLEVRYATSEDCN